MSRKTNLSNASDLSSPSGSVKSVAYRISSNTSAAPNDTSITITFIESRASSTLIDKDKSNFKVLRTFTKYAMKNISIIADGLNNETTEAPYMSRSIFQGKSSNYCFII